MPSRSNIHPPDRQRRLAIVAGPPTDLTAPAARCPWLHVRTRARRTTKHEAVVLLRTVTSVIGAPFPFEPHYLGSFDFQGYDFHHSHVTET